MSSGVDRVPPRIIGWLAGIFEALYTHAEIDRKFRLCGYESSPPEGNKVQKVSEWLHRERLHPENLLSRLGELTEDFMENIEADQVIRVDGKEGTVGEFRERLNEALHKSGLRYLQGGIIRPEDQNGVEAAIPYSSDREILNKAETGIERFFEEKPTAMKNPNVFVVHGHGETATLHTARLVEKLGLTPIILREQPNSGATVIEKFEKHSNVDFAIILMTADDIGCAKDAAFNQDSLQPRARQNVILELGYFIGKLGRKNVCVLKEKGVEEPSDIIGVVYTEFDAGGAWRFELCKELKEAGYSIDMNKL